MEKTFHKPYKIDDMNKGERKYLSKGNKHLNRNMGMWTNNPEMELWVQVSSVKILAPNSSWTLPLTMYR